MTETDENTLEARRLIRCLDRAVLGTLDRRAGGPYASLVMVATDFAGCPLLLVSTLAEHTQNLLTDERVSLLFDGTGGYAEPLTGPRLTITGRIERAEDEAARRRYLARHPDAALYASFKDFSFWRVRPMGGHLVAGFGRIVDIAGEDLLSDVSGAKALAEAEVEVIQHMNEDHADALDLYANRLLAKPGAGWRMTGLDPDGFDLRKDGEVARLKAGRRLRTPGDVRSELVRLAGLAREGQE